MAMRDLVNADCGGANPLMRLTKHYAKDQTRQNIAQGIVRGQQQNDDPFTREFLESVRPAVPPPQTFRMDSLLQEMRHLEGAGAAAATANLSLPTQAPNVSELALEAEWRSSEEQAKRSKGESVLDWTKVFLERNPDLQGPDDPLQKVAVPLNRYDDRWAEEYLSEEVPVIGDQSVVQGSVIDMYLGLNEPHSDIVHSCEDQSIKCECATALEKPLEDQWAEEFADLTDSDLENIWRTGTDSGRAKKQETEEEFWDKLENEWKEMATSSEHPWLGDFEDQHKFEEYNFKDDNPLKEHPDPLEEGRRRLEQGDIPSAVLLFEAAVQQDGENPEAWLLLGTTQAKNEMDRSAIAALKRTLDLDPGNAPAQMALAVSYTNESYQAQACHVLQEWIRNTPVYAHLNGKTSSPPELHSYSSFMSKSLHEETLDMFLRAARMKAANDIDADVQSGLGILFNLSGDFDKAADCFRSALQVRPTDAQLWNKLGATMANGDKSGEAVTAYHRALDQSPGFVRCRYNLGISCVNLKAYTEATEHFLTGLNFQAAGRGPSEQQDQSWTRQAAMSENIWSSLRLCISLLGRQDLYPDVDAKNLDKLNKEFNIQASPSS